MENKDFRAKQFLPFDALTGFREALRKKEVEYVNKIDLPEEMQEIISNKLLSTKSGDIIKIKFYLNGQYKIVQGKINRVDKIKKQIVLCNENATNIFIKFSDVAEFVII